ncbi:ABC transporter ATP-binding protein [Microvirga roseola]|uniref:ABC transporter ATP-binding protein n=1 Tax=Microvirga roseola TaxID=2883126 RepID=UPI001E485872|nr:ABC transporter ATP-binding protein [Microvirga roseola]
MNQAVRIAHGVTVEIASVGKTFQARHPALLPTDLTIPAGEILVLLGPSGCGKTTLLRLIAGLEQPDPGGSIRFDQEDVTGTLIEHRQVGMVFQSYALFPNMTVAENVGYGLKVRGVTKCKRQVEVERLLAMVGLTEFAARRVDRISGGQRQRVALARALAIRPRVLLLDEPLAALDASLREHLRVEIAALLRAFRITAVYVTHDQAEAMAIGDRIAVMSRGRIVQIDTPEVVYQRPATRFAAQFVGVMNRVDGCVRGGRLSLPSGSLEIGGSDRDTALWFRPESVRVIGAENAGLVGTVIGSTFFGATRRLTVVIGAEKPILIDAPATLGVANGDRIGLSIERSAVLELPEDTV